MEKKLLDRRDTDYVRDNLIFNYILGNEQELLIESYVKNNGLELRFDPSHFYFFMTGTHKKFTRACTPETFYDGVSNIYASYDMLRDTLIENGYDGNTFLIKEDNSKQMGVLFSSVGQPALSPEAMARRMLDGSRRGSVQPNQRNRTSGIFRASSKNSGKPLRAMVWPTEMTAFSSGFRP